MPFDFLSSILPQKAAYYHIFTTAAKNVMDIKHKKEDRRIVERVKVFAAPNFNLIQKSGLVYLQAAVYLVEVTGFEPATFWSRSHTSTLHFIRISRYILTVFGLGLI